MQKEKPAHLLKNGSDSPKKLLKKIKVKTHVQLKKELDTWFSRFIRIRDKGQCYTCPKKDEWKNMQNGHFVPRQYMSTRYDEVNCHCQCYACNMLYNGQPSRYAQKLEEEFGIGTVASLEQRRLQIVKNFPFEDLIKKYKEFVEDGDHP